jgi:transposase
MLIVASSSRPPTIGVGLTKRLAKEDGIVVAWTPEHYTTKTHFNCGGECGRFAAAERRRADDHNFIKTKEIRGLKVCKNPECNAPINRDLNAAKNIAANCFLILTGHSPIAAHTTEEAELA